MQRSPSFMTSELPGQSILPTIAVGLVLSAIYLYFFAFQATVDISINMYSPGRTWLKIYWADQEGVYSEQNSRQVLISGAKEKHRLRIDSLGEIARIRLDPGELESRFRLRQFMITQPGYDTKILSAGYGYSGLEPIQQIADVEIDSMGYSFETQGIDGQLEYIFPGPNRFQFPFVHIFSVFSILLGTLIISKAVAPLQKNLMFVPVLLLIAVSLTVTMAVVSKNYWLHPNGVTHMFVHPDEEVHVSAVEYYRDHLLPPAVDSPDIANSFSIYGYTRLSSYELYYPAAGYLTRLLAPFRQPVISDARLIGILLFALMAFFAFRNPEFRPFVAPFLITPQLWYLFSYTNSDGFAIFLTTFAAYQAGYKQSTLNRLLTEQRPANFLLNILWLGLLVGGMLLLKLNFYIFLLFLGVYMLWRIVIGDFPDQKRFWLRLAMIGFVGLSVYGGRIALDYAANGPDRKQKTMQMIEKMAQPLYKPSTDINRKHRYLFMRDRGVTLKYLLRKDKWAGKTFVTAFGAYGFTEFLGSETYFNLVFYLGMALFGMTLFSILIHGPPSSHWLFAITFACTGLLITASLWQSWTISFQAQGRYLAPALPMFGVLYYHVRPWLIHKAFNALIVAMFALGVYSFVFIGLGLIHKIP